MMKTFDFILITLPVAMSMVFLYSCDSGPDPDLFDKDLGIYKVILTASGEDYTAGANITNLSNVPLIDETKGVNMQQCTVLEDFTGEQIYSTSENVHFFTAQGLITSKKVASLRMRVYKDGKSIYENTISITPEIESNQSITKNLIFTNIQ